jgi:hypothetical protein
MAAGELVGRCFHARTIAHILHLKTRSFAAHKALNEFYDAIVPLTDSFAEAYQGEYGLIEDYPVKFASYSDALVLLSELNDWIAANRFDCCDKGDTYLQNIIDEIVALISSTTYKLKFLK